MINKFINFLAMTSIWFFIFLVIGDIFTHYVIKPDPQSLYIVTKVFTLMAGIYSPIFGLLEFTRNGRFGFIKWFKK